ncbi:peptidyl-tRNA hydrolase 2, mitochondrial-like [Neocloeon triangulifer]|uniref:peptidyl-tRNA hydrolase 2, mitochondrial-like n=1 Tax=Neocloeon triangulifer TaxID=2078957 RepID=UPI00286F0A56|nr:peptidyl-tRNA hydrolase 2, mitochondrial-like [Neocloeon triangulifer]XP_059487396.1 peptidyl-tRNA hydrolase 2, mitochondrial-like [Neocloeon triangulifer]
MPRLFFYGLKMALVIRTDLQMKKGKIASQCCHAAIGCYRQALRDTPELLSKWEMVGEPKIVLKCENELEIFDLHAKAMTLGFNTVLIRDAGHTQVAPGTVTALGIGPAEVDPLVKGLKLL